MTTLRTALLLSASLFALAVTACSSDDANGGSGGSGGSGGAAAAGGAGGSGGTTTSTGAGGHFLKKDAGTGADAATEDARAPEPPNSVRVHVEYAGGKSGTMHVGLWKTPPWDGFPDSSKVDDFPTFPYELQLLSVIPGQYTVGVYLDVGSDNADKPGPDDPQYISSTQVTVTEQAGAYTEITLVDP